MPPELPDAMFGPDCLGQRIQAVVFGAIGCLPRALRARAASICHAANQRRLTAAMTRWIRGGPIDNDRFGAVFLGRDGDDPLVRLLHDAIPCVNLATEHAKLGDAATKIAAAMLIVGPDRWSRFLEELEERALDQVTPAAIGGQAHHPHPPGAEVNQAAGSSEPADAGPTGPVVNPPVDEHRAHHPEPTSPSDTRPRGAAGPGEQPRPWRMPSAGIVPPVRNPVRLRPGDASRPAWSGAAGRSLWDEQGGEWQYHEGDGWRHPHWDYNAHSGPNAPWRSIPTTGRSLWKA